MLKSCITIQCRAADKVSVVKVEIFVEVTPNKILGCFSHFQVKTHVFELDFLLSCQLHNIQSVTKSRVCLTFSSDTYQFTLASMVRYSRV